MIENLVKKLSPSQRRQIKQAYLASGICRPRKFHHRSIAALSTKGMIRWTRFSEYQLTKLGYEVGKWLTEQPVDKGAPFAIFRDNGDGSECVCPQEFGTLADAEYTASDLFIERPANLYIVAMGEEGKPPVREIYLEGWGQ